MPACRHPVKPAARRARPAAPRRALLGLAALWHLAAPAQTVVAPSAASAPSAPTTVPTAPSTASTLSTPAPAPLASEPAASPVRAAPGANPWWRGDRPSALALQALAELEGAARQGLDPQDYLAAPLRAALPGLPEEADHRAARQWTQALADSLRRYLLDLHQGRVPPPRSLKRSGDVDADGTAVAPAVAPATATTATSSATSPAPTPAERVDGWLAQALLDGRLDAAVRLAQPRHPLYRELQRALAGATEGAADQPPDRAAQRKIVLTMERLRWIDWPDAPRAVLVNLPEYVLRLVDGEGHRIGGPMRVIIGEAKEHATPLLREDMRSIEFSPYWNVPPSIARDELVPRLRRQPGWGDAQGYEVVGPGSAVQGVGSPGALDAVLAGRARLRQRPGKANALGSIKFVLPNHSAIYLHHTPSLGLFNKTRRDFSHGCIRVQDPVALARFVLGDAPEWGEDRIRRAMAGRNQWQRLPQPVPVLIGYATALVDQGRLRLLDDVYGLDQALEQQLRQRKRPTWPGS